MVYADADRCSKCHARAYVSLIRVECSNPECEDYDPAQAPPWPPSLEDWIRSEMPDWGKIPDCIKFIY